MTNRRNRRARHKRHKARIAQLRQDREFDAVFKSALRVTYASHFSIGDSIIERPWALVEWPWRNPVKFLGGPLDAHLMDLPHEDPIHTVFTPGNVSLSHTDSSATFAVVGHVYRRRIYALTDVELATAHRLGPFMDTMVYQGIAERHE